LTCHSSHGTLHLCTYNFWYFGHWLSTLNAISCFGSFWFNIVTWVKGKMILLYFFVIASRDQLCDIEVKVQVQLGVHVDVWVGCMLKFKLR
jgi:hypothetical protein